MTKPLVLTQSLQLNSWLGGTLAISAVVFGAYLIGIILAPFSFKPIYKRFNGVVLLAPTSQTALHNLIRRELLNARRRDVRFVDLIEQFPDLSDEEDLRYSRSERQELAEEVIASGGPMDGRSVSDVIAEEQWHWMASHGSPALMSRVVQELDLAEVSLQANSKDIYEKYDRLRAEAEFRNAVALPIGALSIALCMRWSFETGSLWGFIFMVGLLPTVFLSRSAYYRDIQANDFIVQAILAGISNSPTLKLLTDIQARLKA